ncbi:MAG: hypothetical protein IJO79_02610 [Firmicutes bacterium]|nr:hypothetical protein [Bacillota bacterium]
MKRKTRRTSTILISLLIICLLSALCFGGCTNTTKEAEDNFAVVVAGKATPEKIAEAAGYLDVCLSKRINEDKASHMVAAYVEYLYRFITTDVNTATLSSLNSYYDFEKNAIDEEKIKLSEELSFYELLKAGHVVITGTQTPGANPGDPTTTTMGVDIYYQGILDAWGDKLTQGMRQVYELNEKIRLEPALENATILVSWQEILDRAYTAEKILTENPEDHLIWDDMNWLYSQYLTILLTGTSNNPVFDYETKHFSVDATTVYKDFVLAYPDTILAAMLTEYFNYLGGINFTLDYNNTEALDSFFTTCDNLAARAQAQLKDATGQNSAPDHSAGFPDIDLNNVLDKIKPTGK